MQASNSYDIPRAYYTDALHYIGVLYYQVLYRYFIVYVIDVLHYQVWLR